MKKGKTKFEKITGIMEKHSRGFGFIKQEEGGDIFIASVNMGGAMNGDLVEVDLLPYYLWEKSKEAIVTKILERNTTEVVGTFQKNRRYGFVVPDNRKCSEDIFIKKEFFGKAENGDKVVVKITKYPDRAHSAEGKIHEIVAKKGQVGSDVLSMIRSAGLFETFPSRVNAEAKARSKEPISDSLIKKRKDLRDWNIITIDGPTAKDLDDGVSISTLENGNFLLGVHIADVSHYVAEDGYIDKEALKRGTSVYLLNRVIPMLPKVLSNGVCSLNPGEDRLTLSCIMEIDHSGTVVNQSIEETVINSKHRMVYDDVSDILEKTGDWKALTKKYEDVYEDIEMMGHLALILRHKRKRNGSLDFDIDEAEILLDSEEKPIDIRLVERRTANRLIEEFMLIANETVAEQFFWMEAPFIYRVHEKPDSEKMEELKEYLKNFNIRLKGSVDNIFPKTLADIITELEGKPYEGIVNRVMLRTMKKAYYSESCDGHFGLAFKYYCHFTSPIRRYPDLMIHRIIKEYLHGNVKGKKADKYKADCVLAADLSSKTERQAQELERDVQKLKKTQYMMDHIGEEFDGIVNGITDFGVYVELPNTVEGMASMKYLRRSYILGEKVRIRVLDAKPSEGQIDFKILE